MNFQPSRRQRVLSPALPAALLLAALTACSGGAEANAPSPPPSPAGGAPALDAVGPATGPETGGTVVTLSGAGFDARATAIFGGVSATVTAATATTLDVIAPPHAPGAVDVLIANPDGQSASLPGSYAYVAVPTPTTPPPPPAPPGPAPAPALASATPASGSTDGGTGLVLAGDGFAPGASVTIGGAPASVGGITSTAISVTTPAHAAGAADIVVTNADGQASTLAAGFTFVAPPPPPPPPPPGGTLPPPSIAGVGPASGPIAGSAAVTVTGSGFVTGSTVSFGGAAAIVGTVTATSIAVITPPGAAGPADVTVTNPDRQSVTARAAYTYVAPPPVVAAINVHGSPQAGGGLLLLAGAGLDNTVAVAFGGAPATGLTYDPLRGALTVTVPPSPLGPTADGFVSIVVTNADGQSATVPGFHYGNPPAPAGFTPDTGPRGAPLVITGTDFTADTTGPRAGLQVSFGGTLASISQKSPTQITVAVPKLNPGVYQVIVTNFDGQFAVAPGTFTAPGP